MTSKATPANPPAAAAQRVPYMDLAGQNREIAEELLGSISKVLDHGMFILGDEVEEFEGHFAQLCGSRYAIGVNSGTDALVMALRVLGVGAGDEVITAPNSFVASAGAAVLAGASPIFADVLDDYNIDPDLVEKAITPLTKAIIPVHLTGRPADMDAILEVAQAHDIHVVEDAAQAVTAEYKGKRVGSFGAVGCFSLHPLKTLGACGDGGVLVTDDPEIHERLKWMRNLGLQTRDKCVEWSGNSRLDTLQAAILLVKLGHLDEWTEGRRSIAASYRRLLDGIDGVQAPGDKSYERAVYHTFVVQADRRDELKSYLAGQGIGTAVHYPTPIHLQPASAGLGYGQGSFPNVERQAGRVLSLPIYPGLEEWQVEYVSGAIREFYEAESRD